MTFPDAEQIHRQPWTVKRGGTGDFCQTCPETTVQSLQVSGSQGRAVNWNSESEMMTLPWLSFQFSGLDPLCGF